MLPVCQLTRLDLDWLSADIWGLTDSAFDVADLAQLGRLTALERLSIKAAKVNTYEPNLGLQFLSNLLALASLTLAMQLPRVQNVDSVGCCTKLRSLLFPVSARSRGELGVAPCLAMSQLTSLTKLLVGWRLSDNAVPDIYKALKQLPQLQEVGARMWTHMICCLSWLLAGLKQLRSIEGGWAGAISSSGSYGANASSCCAQVQQLVGVAGAVPFGAFPGIQWCSLSGSVAPDWLNGIDAERSKLEGVAIEGCSAEWRVPIWPCLDASVPVNVRVAALESLARLPALHTLRWNVNTRNEVKALSTGLTKVSSLAVLQASKSASLSKKFKPECIQYSDVLSLA